MGEFAVLDGLLNAGHIEDQTSVHFRRHHVRVSHAVFGVVLVGARQLAVKRSGHQVAVAVNAGLPFDLHLLGVHASEHAAVIRIVIDRLGVNLFQRHVKFLAAKHTRGVVDIGVHRVALVRENAVKALNVRQLENLVRHHVIHADANQTGIQLVIHPGVFAVVNAILVGAVNVVRVARGEFQRAVRLGAHHGLGFVRPAPSHHGIRAAARNAVQFTARRNAQNAGIARVAAAPDAIVRVQLARMDFSAARAAHKAARLGRSRNFRCGRRLGRSRWRRRRSGRRAALCVFLAGGQADRDRAQRSSRIQEAAATQVGCHIQRFFSKQTHFRLLSFRGSMYPVLTIQTTSSF